jgi:hypothetical protein
MKEGPFEQQKRSRIHNLVKQKEKQIAGTKRDGESEEGARSREEYELVRNSLRRKKRVCCSLPLFLGLIAKD